MDFAGIKLPFSPTDLLNSGMALVGSVEQFILLALAFLIAPLCIKLIFSANVSGKTKAENNLEETTYRSRGYSRKA